MTETLYVQCRLRSAVTGAETVVWLDKIDQFSEGQFVTLKGDEDKEHWEVLWKGIIKKPKRLLRQDWKVGGLS